jgi:hypothetical protein
MSVLHSLLHGLDDQTRTETTEIIARNIAEERAQAPEASRRRAADVGTRSRRSSGPRRRGRDVPAPETPE